MDIMEKALNTLKEGKSGFFVVTNYQSSSGLYDFIMFKVHGPKWYDDLKESSISMMQQICSDNEYSKKLASDAGVSLFYFKKAAMEHLNSLIQSKENESSYSSRVPGERIKSDSMNVYVDKEGENIISISLTGVEFMDHAKSEDFPEKEKKYRNEVTKAKAFLRGILPSSKYERLKLERGKFTTIEAL